MMHRFGTQRCRGGDMGMKLFDCFLFFNELELLELRLMTLASVVDYFVLVEANRTFTGNKKDFIFEKNKDRYKKYLRNIIYIKVEDTPTLDTSKDVWAIEIFQRNCISRGLASAKDEDRVIISDVDEIPDPGNLIKVKDSNELVTFNQYLFYYFVNCVSVTRTWNGSVMAPFKHMNSPQVVRGRRRGYRRIKNGGWHYTYMGGLEKITMKLHNLSDAHTRIDMVGTDEDILRKITSQKSLWDERRTYRLIDVEKHDYAPTCMKKFIEKYPDFYFRPA